MKYIKYFLLTFVLVMASSVEASLIKLSFDDGTFFTFNTPNNTGIANGSTVTNVDYNVSAYYNEIALIDDTGFRAKHNNSKTYEWKHDTGANIWTMSYGDLTAYDAWHYNDVSSNYSFSNFTVQSIYSDGLEVYTLQGVSPVPVPAAIFLFAPIAALLGFRKKSMGQTG